MGVAAQVLVILSIGRHRRMKWSTLSLRSVSKRRGIGDHARGNSARGTTTAHDEAGDAGAGVISASDDPGMHWEREIRRNPMLSSVST